MRWIFNSESNLNTTQTLAKPQRIQPDRLLVKTAIALMLLYTSTGTSQAELRPVTVGEPVWELGLGVTPISMPAYRGSKTQTNRVLPMPYAVYRGDWLRVDRDGIRGLLFSHDRVRLDISADGALPAASDDITLRDGMPDLDAAGEIGPSLNVSLIERDDLHLELQFPWRAVLTTDFSSIADQGMTFHPKLRFSMPDVHNQWLLGGSIGPLFANERYHQYYYGVADRYATANRPAYRAEGGYSGTSLMLTLSKRFDRFWVGGYVRADSLHGAPFTNSPLVETNHSIAAGVGLAWIFARSSQRVTHPETW